MFSFERLAVWGKAIDFADRMYVVTRSFPKEEIYGLSSQLRRASVSISSNIAEGSGRHSRRDFRRFVEIGYGSLLETVSQLVIAKNQGYIDETNFNVLY